MVRGAIIASLLVLVGCQARPLHDDPATQESLGAIEFAEVSTRAGLEVRNRLVFLAGNGAGEDDAPQYRVDLSVSSSAQGVQLNEQTTTPNAGRAIVSATYTLRRTSDDSVIKAGRRQTVALFDYPRQEFAKLRAARDAEDRASHELAELIYADLAIALGR
ncbi:hypothetical protein FE840_004410 [Peteryoungia desertarenae]|uniref:LPS-assembly lipoprotein n=2 Tax=Peteryoungia desertarenae TaxID=1813451 RepID=A0ABX6QRU2_9HYPH|nr:hypothetical protein FE840_004410 [Peteryoungia desertarenae]